MLESTQKVLQEALTLSPIERTVLIDALMSSLDRPDSHCDRLGLSESQDRIHTLEQYNAIQDGMTIEQVRQIMAEEGFLVTSGESGGTVIKNYAWNNPDGSSIVVVFINEAVRGKSHFNLE